MAGWEELSERVSSLRRMEVIQLAYKVITVNSIWEHREAAKCQMTLYQAWAEQATGQRGSLLCITLRAEDKQGMWTERAELRLLRGKASSNKNAEVVF